MITTKIDGKKYALPDRWDDVKYSEYVALFSTPNNLTEYVSLFTGLSVKELLRAQTNAERIALALSFLSIPPKFDAKPTRTVGPYSTINSDKITSACQLDDFQELLKKTPKEFTSIEANLLISDMYLESCAIVVQKIIDSVYISSKVAKVKEELRNYSCIQVIQTGAYFLFKRLGAQPLNYIHQRFPQLN